MIYNRCGRSGVLLPALSLGLWHNFGSGDNYLTQRKTIKSALDAGIVHFDLANNYGVPYGSAEVNFGRHLKDTLRGLRDQLFISSKAGHEMWDGVYGDWCSRKSLIASCDQSLKRVGVDYFDVFYQHRFDPETPLEESMAALDFIVKSGRALYVGISKFPADKAAEAYAILQKLGTPCLAHQQRYSLLNRDIEKDGFSMDRVNGVGTVSFSPLAQGLLTDRYLNGVPEDSRAAKERFLKSSDVDKSMYKVVALNEIAIERGQSLSQMALSWQLFDSRVASVVIGASSSKQLLENIKAIDNISFTAEEIMKIDKITL